MKYRVWNSLAYKLMFALAFYSIVLVATLSYLNVHVVEDNFKEQFRQMASMASRMAEPAIVEAVENGPEAVGEVIKPLIANDIAMVRILDWKGSTFAEAGVRDSEHFVYRFDINSGSRRAKSVEITFRSQTLDQKMLSYYQYLAIIIFGFMVLSLLLMQMVMRVFGPMRELIRKMEAFDPTRPEPIALQNTSRSEIRFIADAANKMVDNIADHAEFMRRMTQKIEEGRAHLKEAQQIARMGSWQMRPDSNDCQFSDQMYVLLGLDPKKKNLNWQILIEYIEPKDRRPFLRLVENTTQSHVPFRLMHEVRTANDEVLHMLTEGKISQAGEHQMLTGITMDVTEQTESQRMIEQLAFYDPLTNLPNRLLLKDRLSKAISDAFRRDERVGVFFLDLDRFKYINDTLGHTIGDQLLKSVADRLRSKLRETDTVSRIGGDEFVIVAPMLKESEDAAVVAKKLLQAMQERWELEDKSIFSTTSIGIALYPEHGEDVDTLIKYADTAMYRAKENGRNNFCMYDTSMGDELREQLKIESEMRNALDGDPAQFELYYQPKIDLESGYISGAEVLLRWKHPSLGMIYPDTFIPVAENTGMIIELGQWVMQESARQIRRWQEEGVKPLRLAINLSGRQFQSPTLMYHIRSVLADYDISPRYMEFEVTESVSMENLQESLRVLNQLKSLGVGVVIDDFGTGYSSLSNLKQFPVDTLKIDKAFIMNMLEDRDDRTIVETIVSMCKAMTLMIVAEGVETIEHVKVLKKLEVDYGQGYYFSKPIPITQFNLMYRKNLEKMRAARAKNEGTK